MTQFVSSLFDADVITQATDYREQHTELYPAEAECLGDAHPKRVREFRAGRHCARLALRRLGVIGVPLLRGKDRAPIWPPSITGSLTHTHRRDRGFCAVVVARDTAYRALGIDAEFDDPLGKGLWRLVLLPSERTFVEGLPEAKQGRTAKLIFSAKECVYKCQYMVTKQFLEFADVSVDLDLDEQRFVATFRRDAGEIPAGTAFDGRFVASEGLLVTATHLRA